MKKLFYLAMLFPITVLGQIKLTGKVIDAVTKQPIPYANLESFKYKAGTQSNQEGIFVLDLVQAKSSDTIKVSCVGYQDILTTQLQNSHALTYELKPISIVLKEVLIKKGKSIIKEIGFVEDSGNKSSFFSHLMQRAGAQYAMLMKNNEDQKGYLKKIFFFIGNEGYDAPFRIRIYENFKNRPGKDLLGKSIELQGHKKKSWNEFDFAEYNILVPEEGVFVAIEWIANEKYKFEDSYSTRTKEGEKAKKTFFYYGPEIIKKMDTKYGLTYTKTLGNNWYMYRAGAARANGGGFKYSGFSDIMIKAAIEIIE